MPCKLEKFGAKTRRRFGQNFLDREMSEKIASDLPCSAQDEILEIGPGHGALTEWLVSKCSNLTAVEIDNFCIPKLQEKFRSSENFNLVHKNFLQFDIEAWLCEHPSSWLAGNLPYNMATAIIAHILPHISKTKGCMFMTQLEVAERITAHAGSKSYGSFSVFCACYSKSRIMRRIGPEHFNPKPKVSSATIFLEPLESPLCTGEDFFAFVKAAFSQKRKTLANSLSSGYDKEKIINILKNLNFTENTRAEELSLENLVAINNLLTTNY